MAVPHSGEGGEYYYLKGTKPSKTSDISKSSSEKNLEDQNEKDLKTTTAATTTSPVSPPFRTGTEFVLDVSENNSRKGSESSSEENLRKDRTDQQAYEILMKS